MTESETESENVRDPLDDEGADVLIDALRGELMYDHPLPSGMVARLQARRTREGDEQARSALGTRLVLGALLFSAVALTQPGAPLIAGVLVAALFAWRIDFGAADGTGA